MTFFYCTFRLKCYLTITRDEYVDTMSVFGWIRKVGWIKKLPFAIQKMINNNVCNEMLHVVEFMERDHWEISVVILFNHFKMYNLQQFCFLNF